MFFFLREESFISSEFSSVEEAEGFGPWPVSPRYRVSVEIVSNKSFIFLPKKHKD